MSTKTSAVSSRENKRLLYPSWKKDFKRNKVLYLLFVPVAVYFIVFNYAPLSGLVLAFKSYSVSKGIFGSDWVGLENFKDLFTGEAFALAMRNTIAMALMNLIVGFAVPVILALLICEVRSKVYRRTVQTISYMPYFIAAVVVSALAKDFFSSGGAITQFLSLFGLEQQNWIANPDIPVFWFINTFIEVWRGSGYGTIVYVAAIMGVNGDLYEAAAMDGANRWKRITRITLPSIMPLIVMMLTMRVGTIFVQGFDMVLLLYMPSTYVTADVISTYTYRMAFGSTINYGLSTASGLFQSIIGTVLLFFSNWLNRKSNDMALF